ncbi:NDR1/HIN1-like protein 6 [Zingiber officinale]|nr:NDR1/HIN1-like protein 6 [Zingiber officinale]
MAADRGGRASMAERVHPSAKPTAQPPQAAATGVLPSKGGPLPVYRPQPRKAPPPPRRRWRRSCCCSCCLWFTLILFLLILLSAASFGVFYFIYRPQRPAFAVSALRLAAFNVSAGGRLSSRLDLNVTARNPNRKLVFLYDPSSVSVFSGGVDVGDGSFPAFRQGAKNTTLLSATLAAGGGQTLDSAATRDLRERTRLSLEIDVDTKVGVKIGNLKTKRIGVKVQCSGIDVAVPTGKAAATASSSNAACKVKLRIKIWKWTIS